MTKSFNLKQVGPAVACSLALGILSGAVRAQDINRDDAFCALEAIACNELKPDLGFSRPRTGSRRLNRGDPV